MPAIVSSVIKDSIAEELGIESGDEILSIDDTNMLDMIDYNFLCKSDLLTLEIKKTSGDVEVIELEKDFDNSFNIMEDDIQF